MASTSAFSPTQTGFSWQIVGLQYTWGTDSGYSQAYVTVSGVGTSAPVYPPPSSTNYETGIGSFSGLSPGTTYTVNGYVVFNGNTNSVGSTTITTQSPPRPSNFAWTYQGLDSSGIPIAGSSKMSGLGFYVTANEWLNLQTRINDFRAYKGLSSYPFSSASSGGGFYYWYFNEAVNALSAMTSAPSTVSSGQDIYASYLNGLMDSLNSIP